MSDNIKDAVNISNKLEAENTVHPPANSYI